MSISEHKISLPPFFFLFQSHFLEKNPVTEIAWENVTNIPRALSVPSVFPLLKTIGKKQH